MVRNSDTTIPLTRLWQRRRRPSTFSGPNNPRNPTPPTENPRPWLRPRPGKFLVLPRHLLQPLPAHGPHLDNQSLQPLQPKLVAQNPGVPSNNVSAYYHGVSGAGAHLPSPQIAVVDQSQHGVDIMDVYRHGDARHHCFHYADAPGAALSAEEQSQRDSADLHVELVDDEDGV